MNLEKTVKKALDSLPFDGSKTKIGAWGAATGGLGSFLPLPIPADPTTMIVTSLITFAVGRLHKWLKKKYPQVEWPQSK